MERLSEELGKQLWFILSRTLDSIRLEPTVIVTALRIIEREERWEKRLSCDDVFVLIPWEVRIESDFVVAFHLQTRQDTRGYVELVERVVQCPKTSGMLIWKSATLAGQCHVFKLYFFIWDFGRFIYYSGLWWPILYSVISQSTIAIFFNRHTVTCKTWAVWLFHRYETDVKMSEENCGSADG